MLAAAALKVSASNPPVPLTLSIAAVCVPGVLAYTSLSAATVTNPLVAPAWIVICSPLSSSTVTSLCAGFAPTLAVYVIVPPSFAEAVADSVTVAVSITDVTSIVIVLGLASRSTPPLAVPPLSCTWNVKLAYATPLASAAGRYTGVPDVPPSRSHRPHLPSHPRVSKFPTPALS